MDSQKYSLKWNEFGVNVASTMRALHADNDFVDVTLACADGARLGAHKLVLSSVSVFFRDVLKQFPCEHPILVLNETSGAEAKALLEFAYTGEVNVAQEVLPALLHTARQYNIKGLDQVENPVQNKVVQQEALLQAQRLPDQPQVEPLQQGEVLQGEPEQRQQPQLGGGISEHFLVDNKNIGESNSIKRRRNSGSTGTDDGLGFLCRTPPPKRWKRSFTMNSSELLSNLDPSLSKPQEKHLVESFHQDSNLRRNLPFSLPTSPVTVDEGHQCLAIDYSRPLSALKTEECSRSEGDAKDKVMATSTSPMFKAKMGEMEGRFHCDICGKVFKHPGSLQHHRHIHRGTHCCPTCGKAFSRRWDLERHMNKSKYGCPANRFGQNDNNCEEESAAAASVLALARSRRSQ